MARPGQQHDQSTSKQEVRAAAMAWAEFLYDEYVLEKQKQLLLDEQNKTIELKEQGGEG